MEEEVPQYRFAALGPFEVPTKKVKGVKQVDFSANALTPLFDEAEAQCSKKLGLSGIRNAVGCYVFALQPSGPKKIIPYYVGQARKQTFWKRVFQKGDKPKTYNEILGEKAKARAVVYFLPLLTKGGKFARKGSNAKLIDQAEYTLIGMALRVNYDIWNRKHAMGMLSFSIDGTPYSGARTKDATSFKRMLGFAERPKRTAGVEGDIEALDQEALAIVDVGAASTDAAGQS